ncbi:MULTISPECIES: hypothetical protein [unclassified Arthrobacter]|uniref:hypothetical protein n=1 Tax=unclassified Arthrobacter TaxID=235627 RepID=UPI001492FFF3|nr:MULTISPECIES: hypothetical protein [unclassified Arthrobacter]MBE0009664.1 hypothetical protein [Arthrobacter sp. AET 35A]NOJ63644.1 hypothetical protein [Arthrobacter sp. 147(2020)]
MSPRAARIPCLAVSAALAFVGVGMAPVAAAPGPVSLAPAGSTFLAPAPAETAPLTNTSHLDWLLDEVPVPDIEGHSTYRSDEQPAALAPWTYADRNDDGTYRKIGGGNLDAEGNWSQGAYNADDVSRTAVVYLRHWQQTGSEASRESAFQTLRSLAYLQTTDGPNAGNVVLWQQTDGDLNPSAEPIELPDPSDSAESYWVARTVWALGEGYAAFRDADPEFAAFLQDRLHLSLDALNRQSLSQYGQYEMADGKQVPAWLIADGADSSAEAVLGLSAYVEAAPTDEVARTALVRLSEGIAEMSSGDTQAWPFGAILPWTKSQTFWHAWGGMAPAAVADASVVLDRQDLADAAVRDTAGFTAQLIVAGGPDNAWTPTPSEQVQIAYGVDSRLQSLVATAEATGATGLYELAAVMGGWYFGANRSGEPTYNPATGVTFDGVQADGSVNFNSGAESTIHGLLSMLVLDAHPELKADALGINETVATDGLTVVEAESGAIRGNGSMVTAESAWTGEANISGGAFAQLSNGARLRIPVPAHQQDRNVYPIVNRTIEEAGTTAWSGKRKLGTTPNGGAGEQGITDAPGLLQPFSLDRELAKGERSVTASVRGAASIDALLLQPVISSVTVDGPAGESTIYVSASGKKSLHTVDVPRGYRLEQQAFDAAGQPVKVPGSRDSGGKGSSSKGPDGGKGHGKGKGHDEVYLAPGGFTETSLVRR